jgi:transcriptional/translational regulatory protein YebC/TACO1
MMAALEGGADDVEAAGDQWEVTCAPGDLAAVRAAVEDAGVVVEQGEVSQIASVSVPVNEAGAPKVLRLVDALEDLDDVQSVHANFDIPDDVLASLE